ncbi:hypothetical protein [Nocardia blacklockiae]|uniref:hypothetical protein n=1 Tax=Nocardia blacklockiae TaxID=480036 RepID=UPI0018957B54|nr:hypothetical protein [Nocardia blacklockiae]MBF6169930.1 hypothetical protein [Nocardia blacklockiae]
MTHGSPPNPPDPAWHPGPQAGYGAPPPSYPNAPAPQPYPVAPQQPWAHPGASAAGAGRGGIWFAVGAVLLGIAGCVVPLLPAYPFDIDPTGLRPYLGLPFGVAGLVLGIVGCTGIRRGKALAVIGVVLSLLALAVEFMMFLGRAR